MRIGIREQLGLLVLLTTLIALAVVAVATVCIHLLEVCRHCTTHADFLHSGSITTTSLSELGEHKTNRSVISRRKLMLLPAHPVSPSRHHSTPTSLTPICACFSQALRLCLHASPSRALYSATIKEITQTPIGCVRLQTYRVHYREACQRTCYWRPKCFRRTVPVSQGHLVS